MALKVDWPDVHYGFWVTFGVLLALAVYMAVRHLAGAATRKAKSA